MQKKYKHIFFDLDGTLWDYEKSSEETILELFHLYDLQKYVAFPALLKSVIAANEYMWLLYREKRITKDELRNIRFQKALSDLGIDDNELASQLNSYYTTNCKEKSYLIEGAKAALDYLSAKNYSLHILSNGFADSQQTKLVNCGIREYFSTVITSESSAFTKPQKEYFEFAMRRIGAVNLECIMIGDSWEVDIIGAQNAGIEQIYFVNNKLKETLKQVSDNCTYTIHQLSDLKRLF
ncbi:MAG: YjjG family noncanonical pyrimidine nucleotidase [Bacteroidetes bacterium]|nr:YjjG family noncanonical pyrimidine nucleotidase [Bacteroidota bacterium]